MIRRRPAPSTVLRVVVALVVIGAAVSSLTGLPGRRWRDPEPSLKPSRSAIAGRTLAALHDDGVRFSARQDDALRRLISLWERRADVRSSFVTGTGDPDLVTLLRWAGQDNDPDAVELALLRPALSEAAARMGVLDVGGGIVAVLSQALAMRSDPGQRLGGPMWSLIEVWNRRPDVRERFSSDGVVNVRGLFTWASAVPVDDPDFPTMRVVAGDFDRLIDDLPTVRTTVDPGAGP